MNKNVEKFLVEYKEMEQRIRFLKGKEIREIEEELGEGNVIGNKLRICRQLRNFISHNDYNNFITIDKGMIKFIKEYYKSIKDGKKPIKAKKQIKTNKKNETKKTKGKSVKTKTIKKKKK